MEGDFECGRSEVDDSRVISRRHLLVSSITTPVLGFCGELLASMLEDTRKLKYMPPPLSNPIVVNLENFRSLSHFPGWDASRGKIEGSISAEMAPFPNDRDVLILGKLNSTWEHEANIRGGRSVVILGGHYIHPPKIEDFSKSATMEGIRISPQQDVDVMSMIPAASFRQTSVFILNCLVDNVFGSADGVHGDAFQLAGSKGNPPSSIFIDKYDARCHYQGLMLAPQITISSNPPYAIPSSLKISRTVLRKGRASIIDNGRNIALFYPIDIKAELKGNRPYQKTLSEFYVVPWRDEGLAACIASGGTTEENGIDRTPLLSGNGLMATYDRRMLVDGAVNYSLRPPTFVYTSVDHMGAVGVPGCGYQSPGYEN